MDHGNIDQRSENHNNIELSKGFYFNCGIKGCKLNMVQKRKIAIARALIKKPKIILLDEAFVGIKEESQKKIHRSIIKMMKKKKVTQVIISNNPRNLKNCDTIYVI